MNKVAIIWIEYLEAIKSFTNIHILAHSAKRPPPGLFYILICAELEKGDELENLAINEYDVIIHYLGEGEDVVNSYFDCLNHYGDNAVIMPLDPYRIAIALNADDYLRLLAESNGFFAIEPQT